MNRFLLTVLLALTTLAANATERQKLNFNAGWRMAVGDFADARNATFDDSGWQSVTLPFAFNGNEAFKKDIVDLTDTISWYRKSFTLSEQQLNGKVFIEFEGVRQGADFFINGHNLGFSENGVMACGFDLTPHLVAGENVIAVRCDNSWQYRSRTHNSRYQWNDKNFNANYGGIPKNVFLHITGKLYQTLPLYSNLGTTGTYIYATDFDIKGRKATIHVESQVKNEDNKARTFRLFARVVKPKNELNVIIPGKAVTLQPGEMRSIHIKSDLDDLHFWSWGYGYLYTVQTYLVESEDASSLNLTASSDEVVTRTGFRKTEFKDGRFYLNDRVLMVHGYAQRTSNEWPGTGLSVPAWLSDYSNDLIVKSGGNLVRWMHVCPWKQDIESCDRVGLIQAMPAGDAEKDVDGPRWAQRTELMRDAIIYNRNNPSIVFYECGNFRISKEHMEEMKHIRDQYDPHGGRAIGSREMLDRPEAEYGGEMLYINKSASKPMWSMEYYRDEGLRKYWDEYSYPYHKEGDGPLYRNAPAPDYNHNMDMLACGMVERWHEYWLERPGTGRRVSDGGVKIVFSDTNTHHRGESNYRTSGVVDAMRIPKDAFYAHQVMWDGWVSPERDRTYIVGHWNYGQDSPEAKGQKAVTKKPVYVVSTGDEVELFVNGRSLGRGERSFQWLFTFKDVEFEPGKLEAVAYTNGKETSRYSIETAGEPYQLKLTTIENPEGFKADGADMALVQVEVVDRQGRRCPLDDRMVHFEVNGELKWIGGIGTRNNKDYLTDGEKKDPSLLDSANKRNLSDNYVGLYDLPVECGINRVLIKSTATPGEINISACADGVLPAYISTATVPVDVSTFLPQLSLKPRLDRGETPSTPSYTDIFESVGIAGATAGCNTADLKNTYDDNELTEWKSDGERQNAWVKYNLSRSAAISEITLKLTGWRSKSYPLEVYAGKKKVWEGITPATLGYVHIKIDKPVAAKDLTIRMVAPVQNSTKFGQEKELAGGVANEMDRIRSAKGKTELRIVEADLLEAVKPERQ
ncbi:MAG: DUF4982 domain-containing protein [Prevotella sp.]|nr:DUF4982 domain-containing protein [Prevotella sp.]